MSLSLDEQIAQMEKDLKYRKLAVKVRSRGVITTTYDKLASPTALCVAVGTGFFIGKMTDRPKQKKDSDSDAPSTNMVTKILRIVAGVQTANSFAKHL